MPDHLVLKTTRQDIVAALARGSVGAIPFAGSLLVEIVDAVIPGQKLDRVVDFIRALSEQAQVLEERQSLLEQQLRSDEGSDLLEEGILQASRAISAERREAIARILVSGISEESLEYDRTKKLLSILNDLTDSELLLLQYYAEPVTMGSPRHKAMMETNPGLLRPVSREMGRSSQEAERGAFRDSYERTLVAHGLLERTQHGLSITTLGRFLVDRIKPSMSV